MKRILFVLLVVLLCLGVAGLYAAAEDKAAPPDAAATTQEDVRPDVPPLTPYTYPNWEDYKNTDLNYEEVCYDWESSLMGVYYRWTREPYLWGDRPNFDRAFRAFYQDDPLVTIDNHIVYLQKQKKDWDGNPVGDPYLVVLDYFDTDEAERTITKLRIPAKVGGLAVRDLYMYSENDYGGNGDNFYQNDLVKSVVVKAPLQRVSDYAFSNFTALKKVTLPDTVTEIGHGAFRGCRWLSSIKGCGDITIIGNAAFQDCRSLDFRVPETLQHIGDSAYRNSGIRNAVLPAGVDYTDFESEMATCVFADCERLVCATFRGGDREGALTIHEFMFQHCPLYRVKLPKNYKVWVGRNAFAGTALGKIINASSLWFIDSQAFANCHQLRSLTLPADLHFAAWDAFIYCGILKSVTIAGKDPALFNDCGETEGDFTKPMPKGCTVYVKNAAMKQAVKESGFKGAIKIRVKVAAPKTVTLARKKGAVTLRWSKVKAADGYCIYSYDQETGRYTKLAAVKANKTSVTLQSDAAQFAVRAYRVLDGDVSWSEYRLQKKGE